MIPGAIDQTSWDVLFSWLTGKRCMLPEGCEIPVEGVAFYLVLLLAAVAVYLNWERITGFVETLR